MSINMIMYEVNDWTLNITDQKNPVWWGAIPSGGFPYFCISSNNFIISALFPASDSKICRILLTI